MKNKFPRATGIELIKFLCNNFGCQVIKTTGSHAKLVRNGVKFTAWYSKKEDFFQKSSNVVNKVYTLYTIKKSLI